MFNDTIALGTTPVTYTKRSPRGTRSVFVPTGDTPSNERRLEIDHEVTSAKRVNSLVKTALVRAHPVTSVLEEIGIQITIKRPASASEAEVQLIGDHLKTMLSPGNITKLFNQEK